MVPITCSSVGDILAISGIVCDIARALNESRGSPAEYRDFIREVDSLKTTFAAIERILQDSSDAELRHAILKEIEERWQLIRGAMAKLDKFAEFDKLTSTSPTHHGRFSRAGRKLQWRFFHRKEIYEYEESFRACRTRLDTFIATLSVGELGATKLQVSNLGRDFRDFSVTFHSGFRRMQEEVTSIGNNTALLRRSFAHIARGQVTLRREVSATRQAPARQGIIDEYAVAICVTLAICATVDVFHRSLRMAVLYTALSIAMRTIWRQQNSLTPSISTESTTFVLIDFLDRRIPFDLSSVQSFDRFRDALAGFFTAGLGDVPGGAYVRAGAYEISDASNPVSVLRRETWEIMAVPGAELEMSIVILQVQSPTRKAQCPWCRAESISYSSSEGEDYACMGCGRGFRKANIEETAEDASNHFDDRTTRSGPSSLGSLALNISSPDLLESHSHENVMQHLRRVRLRFLRLKLPGHPSHLAQLLQQPVQELQQELQELQELLQPQLLQPQQLQLQLQLRQLLRQLRRQEQQLLLQLLMLQPGPQPGPQKLLKLQKLKPVELVLKLESRS